MCLAVTAKPTQCYRTWCFEWRHMCVTCVSHVSKLVAIMLHYIIITATVHTANVYWRLYVFFLYNYINKSCLNRVKWLYRYMVKTNNTNHGTIALYTHLWRHWLRVNIKVGWRSVESMLQTGHAPCNAGYLVSSNKHVFLAPPNISHQWHLKKNVIMVIKKLWNR